MGELILQVSNESKNALIKYGKGTTVKHSHYQTYKLYKYMQSQAMPEYGRIVLYATIQIYPSPI